MSDVATRPTSSLALNDGERERWMTIPGWEGYYSVSDRGCVRSEARTTMRNGRPALVRERVLAAPLGGTGQYRTVTLSGAQQRVVTTVGRLVLLAFVGAPPAGTECCHNNGISTDDTLTNLRWDTHQANGADMVRHGTSAMSRRTHCPHGHAYDEANTIRYGNGRWCRACRTNRKRTRKDPS